MDAQGRTYVKRNPAMVTRELSEYANREGYARYRVTTLNPINPANAPTKFERKNLLLFEQGIPEIVEIVSGEEGKALHYMAPLKVEESCLACHVEQGYKPGDIRGALNVSIPMAWAFDSIRKNNRMLLSIALITIMFVGLTIYLLIDTLVVRRINGLAREMTRYPLEDIQTESLPKGDDEIGALSLNFQELCARLSLSQKELATTREQAFQNEKLAAVGRLAAGVAHEINNPLNGMLNCVKSLRTSPEDATLTRRYLPLLDKGLKRIGNIVQQLLHLGRQEPLTPRLTDIDGLIKDSLVLLEYATKNIDLKLDLTLTRSHLVDAQALQQIIVNICLNATQAMPSGGSLSVTSAELGNRISLSFTDTGDGISPEDIPHIFDPFFTTKEIGRGSGLGLSVTHSLVQRMGGEITVESAKGKGTCFTITIPENSGR